jgi:hypothetical protein
MMDSALRRNQQDEQLAASVKDRKASLDMQKKRFKSDKKQRELDNRLNRKKAKASKQDRELFIKLNKAKLKAVKDERREALLSQEAAIVAGARQKQSRQLAERAALDFHKTITSLFSGSIDDATMNKAEEAYRRALPAFQHEDTSEMVAKTMDRSMKRFEAFQRGADTFKEYRIGLNENNGIGGSFSGSVRASDLPQYNRYKDRIDQAKAVRDSATASPADKARAQKSIDSMSQGRSRILGGGSASPAAPSAGAPAARQSQSSSRSAPVWVYKDDNSPLTQKQ